MAGRGQASSSREGYGIPLPVDFADAPTEQKGKGKADSDIDIEEAPIDQNLKDQYPNIMEMINFLKRKSDAHDALAL